MRIFALTPEPRAPTGGIRAIYRHVDVLNENGFSAYVVHPDPGYRASWFENDTRVILHVQGIPTAQGRNDDPVPRPGIHRDNRYVRGQQRVSEVCLS
jgi:hypothetical protein